jgi:hypothetical protein
MWMASSVHSACCRKRLFLRRVLVVLPYRHWAWTDRGLMPSCLATCGLPRLSWHDVHRLLVAGVVSMAQPLISALM